MWPKTRHSVENELGLLRRLVRESELLLLKVRADAPDHVELMAIAAIMHSYYTGIENIFKRISQDIDGKVPSGPTSHSDLLAAMERETNTRPAVISADLALTLEDYLSFRHVFRQAYSFYLDWSKMSGLFLDCEAVLDRLESELNLFFGQGGD